MKTVYAHDVIASVQSHMNMDADGKWRLTEDIKSIVEKLPSAGWDWTLCRKKLPPLDKDVLVQDYLGDTIIAALTTDDNNELCWIENDGSIYTELSDMVAWSEIKPYEEEG